MLDPNILLTGLFVAIPATIAAVASLRNGRAMRTNNGKRPGEYLELTAAATLEQGLQLDSLERAQGATHRLVVDHLADSTVRAQQMVEIVVQGGEMMSAAEGRIAHLDEMVQEHVTADIDAFARIESQLGAQNVAAEKVRTAAIDAAETIKAAVEVAAEKVRVDTAAAAEQVSAALDTEAAHVKAELDAHDDESKL